MKTKRNLLDKLFGLNKQLDLIKENDTRKISDPYIFEVENTTDEENRAVIFGWNKYWNKPNLGSDEGVVIRNILGSEHGIDYSYLLAQSANQPFKIGKWRFESANSRQLFCELEFIHTDANGKMYAIPLNLAIMRDAYQFQSDILYVTKPLTVTGGTDISFIIQPKTSILFTVYPVSILSGKAELNKSNRSNPLRVPRLSGKNIGNVLVMSSQEMRWSEKLNKMK